MTQLVTTPPVGTLYEMTMLDTTQHAGQDSRPGLDEIATRIYGKKYVGQQTGDMLSNDSWHVYDFPNKDECEEWAGLGNLNPYVDPLNGNVTYLSVAGWQARDKSADKYNFEDYRTGPEPRTMLATLILDGHLPYGRYLIEVSW